MFPRKIERKNTSPCVRTSWGRVKNGLDSKRIMDRSRRYAIHHYAHMLHIYIICVNVFFRPVLLNSVNRSSIESCMSKVI